MSNEEFNAWMVDMVESVLLGFGLGFLLAIAIIVLVIWKAGPIMEWIERKLASK